MESAFPLRLELRELRGEPKSAAAQASQITGASQADIDRIRDEGLNRSQVMPTLSYLTDVIGPRLTASPNLKRANEWSRDKLTSWGLVNAHLEPWGPFGRGWSLKQFSIHVVEPQTIPLVACPKAWTPGFDKPLVAEVKFTEWTAAGEMRHPVYLGLRTDKKATDVTRELPKPLREAKPAARAKRR